MALAASSTGGVFAAFSADAAAASSANFFTFAASCSSAGRGVSSPIAFDASACVPASPPSPPLSPSLSFSRCAASAAAASAIFFISRGSAPARVTFNAALTPFSFDP